MVSEIGFSEVLSLAQTIGIVGTMVLTLYFSKRQIQSLSIDQQTRVLNERYMRLAIRKEGIVLPIVFAVEIVSESLLLNHLLLQLFY